MKGEDGVDERKLICDAKAGDRQAFGELVRFNQKMVYRTVLRIVGNEDDAMDTTQEAFVRAFIKIQSFRGASSFGTWVCRIAMNLALNMLRDRKSTVDHETVALCSPPKDILAEQESYIFKKKIAAAIEELPPKQKLTLLMKVKDGKRHNEIAELLGCAVGTSKANYHMAVLNLRKALSDLLPREGDVL